MSKDVKTLTYFDENTPEYSEDRYNPILEVLNKYPEKNTSLADIGCGTGNILKIIVDNTNITDVTGIDISHNYLKNAQEKINCTVFQASILDDNFKKKITKRFNYVIIGSVLHHLVGNSRQESRNLSITALSNALSILKPGGKLVIFEPVFWPKVSMGIVFYIKKLVTLFTRERVGIFGYWNNIGEPVVSYYDEKQIVNFMSQLDTSGLSYKHYMPHKISLIMKLAGIYKRGDLILIYKK